MRGMVAQPPAGGKHVEDPTSGLKTRVRRGACPRTAPLGARAEKHLSRETALRAKRGAPFAVTRYRVLKPLVASHETVVSAAAPDGRSPACACGTGAWTA